MKQVTHLIRDEKPDLLHCHNIYHQLTPSIINAASRLKIPVVLTLHDLQAGVPGLQPALERRTCARSAPTADLKPCSRNAAPMARFGRSALLWAEARYHAAARSYQRVDMFIAPSRFMRDDVVRRFGEDKVIHIPNGIDTSRIQVSEHDEGFVLYLGRLSPEKGVETLLRAHAADNAAWRLVVAGSGPLLEDLQSRFPLAEFTGPPDRRSSRGQTERSVCRCRALRSAHENSPLSILEAMAHAKPIVASRIGGIPEMVRDGETGLLFEPKDTQATVQSDQDAAG